MTVAIVSLALAALTQDVTLGTVDVGGRQIAVTVPAERGPFDESTPNVSEGGWKFTLLADGTPDVRYRSDGGWGEVADAYPAAAQRAATAQEYKIKVFLFTNTAVLERSNDGVWRGRNGIMSGGEQAAVFSALARFKALAETATHGGVRITFDVTVDDDLLFRVARPQEPSGAPLRLTATDGQQGGSLLGADFIYREVGPRVNNDPFQADDGIYRGPYSSVFVVHSMRTWDVSTYVLDRTPLTSVSWATFSDRDPGSALSIQLFYAWVQHLTLSALAHGHSYVDQRPLPTGDDLPRAPRVFSVEVPRVLLTMGNHLASPSFSDGTVASPRISTEPKKPEHNGRTVAQPILSPPPTQGTLEFAPSTVGDFTVELVDDPIVTRAVTVHEKSYFRRGHVVLASSDPSAPLFNVTQGTGVWFRVSCDLPDGFVMRFVTADGEAIDAQLYGKTHVPFELSEAAPKIIDVSRQPGPYWSEFKIDLGSVLAGKSVVEVQIAPPRFSQYYDRLSDGSKNLKVGPVSFGPMSSPDTASPPAPNKDIEWLASLSGTLPEADMLRMGGLLSSSDKDVRLNALGAMTRTKKPELVRDIARSVGSSDYGTAHLAIQALRHQDVVEAWSMIAYGAIQGPFSHNFQFVAEALQDKVEDTTLQVLGIPLLQRSWHTRLAAVRTVNKIETEVAAVVAAATLTTPEPDAAVRFELAQNPRHNSELFARRLLWSAVNDNSEWVRAASYVSLLDSPYEQIRDQAMRGVRDESVAVRLAVLDAMTKSPKEHYRTALRAAVIDPVAVVRAAALKAFAVQPGEVVVAEVQNTLNDSSPIVKAALQDLAKAKGLNIPPGR